MDRTSDDDVEVNIDEIRELLDLSDDCGGYNLSRRERK